MNAPACVQSQRPVWPELGPVCHLSSPALRPCLVQAGGEWPLADAGQLVLQICAGPAWTIVSLVLKSSMAGVLASQELTNSGSEFGLPSPGP